MFIKPVVQTIQEKSNSIDDFQYASKFRSAVITFILFILFQQNVSYQILELLMGTFTNVSVTNEGCPNFLGTVIMSFLAGLIVFLS